MNTERLELVPATVELVELELDDAAKLARRLHAALPGDWPPEHHDTDVLRFTLDALARPGVAGWWLHWFVWTGEPGRTLVGTGGYVGPPGEDGTIEIGYSVVPSWQRRGIATEATAGLIAGGRARGARDVIAHTKPELAPSIGVLEKLGFVPAEPPEPGVIAFRLPAPA